MSVHTFVFLISLCLLHQVLSMKIPRDDPPGCSDPRIFAHFRECPLGYCCVRDEFFPTYIYCKRIGNLGDNCATRDTESDCPCASGLYCKPNIESPDFHSLYGTCTNVTSTRQPHTATVAVVGR